MRIQTTALELATLTLVIMASSGVLGASSYRGITVDAPTGSPAIKDTGLVFAFDMSSMTEDGQLRDFSGNGHHGTLERTRTGPNEIDDEIDSRQFNSTRFDSARVFRSVTDRVRLVPHDDFDLNGPLTIAAWLRVDQLGLHQHVVACDDKWALWITPDDRYRLGDTQGGGWSTKPGAVARGVWRSVVAVLHGTRGDALGPSVAALYVDGELAPAETHLRTEEAQNLGSWSPSILHRRDSCYIGFESHQGNEEHQDMPFVGAIDQLMLFRRAWSEEEIRAFTNAAPASAEQEILATVQTFFDTMNTRDVRGARRVLIPDGRFHNVRSQGGGEVINTFSNQEYLDDLAKDEAVFLERMWQPEVRIHGGIATVWTRYDFHVDGAFSHCGVDSFQLIETAEGWKISGGAYTVERTGCPESPLGPP